MLSPIALDDGRHRRWLPTIVAAVCLVSGVNAREISVDASRVCVTNGVVEKVGGGGFVINSSSSRAIVKGVDDSSGSLRFEYLGTPTKEAPLASGVVRRQLGIKLRAVDSCNVIYAMWSLEPEQGLIVSMKVNKGKSTHAQCGVKGYKLLKPSLEKPVAPIKIGEPRTLSAAIDGSILKIKVDGQPVWEGEMLADAGSMYGYAGIRTDNVRVRFDWLADDEPKVALSRSGGRSSQPAVACKPVARGASDTQRTRSMPLPVLRQLRPTN